MKLRRASNVAPRKWRCSWLSVILFLVVAMMVYQFSLVSPSLQEGLLAGHNIIQSSLLETHWRLPDIIITEAAAQNFTYQYQTDSKEIPLVLVPKNKSRNVRFLFGIMSYDHAIELRRRNQIRNTYLSYYRQFTDTPHKICALADLIEATTRNANDKNSKSSILLENCELAYTFVVGANPDGPTQLLEFNESYPIAIDHEKIQKPERDVVYLNIKENGKFGKSPTWFKYGLEVMKNYPQLYWDYIVKTDSDTALYPHFFFEMVERRLSPFPDNVLVYGGSPFDKYMCGYPEHDHCANLTAPIYMGGGFYFLSPDLADYITGPDCPRSKLFLPHEDMTTGNYVHSHPKNITMVAEKHGYRDLWRHAVKNPHRLARYFYEYYLDQMVKRKIVTREQVDSWKALVTKNKLVLGLK